MHITQDVLNRCLWTAGLLLQSVLLIALVARQEARRFPIFTLLIAFYTIRTAVLYALSGHIAGTTYGSLYEGLSLVDLALQLLVVAEIARYMIRQRGGWTWPIGGVLFIFLALAVWGSWLASIALRAAPRIAIDRGQIFTAFLMLLLFGWALWSRTSGPVRRIVAGFAFYGLASILSQVERIRAFNDRDARSFMAWEYVPAAAYLCVVVFWILTVKSSPEEFGAEVGLPASSAVEAG